MDRSKTEQPLETFGEYDVYEMLGEGGMAKVHRAKKRGIAGFQRAVALKRLLEPLADDEKFIDSFVREARLASYLNHANIIQIYDLGQVGKSYFIAMELVRGRDLRRILKQTAHATGPMPVPIMLYLIRQLCDALEYAHNLQDEHGEPLCMVHRDISPSNLLVAEDGNLKIIDFGIAKAAPTSLHTQSGRLKGKFSYMAPEVIRGHSFEHRSDLFAVGIVAYELLTARPLFAAKNEYETLRRITQKEVAPPSRRNPGCPPQLDAVVLRALAKSPAQRWRTAGELLSALDQVAKKLSLQANNREVAEWMAWAFQQPLQRKRVDKPLKSPIDLSPEPPADPPTVAPPKPPEPVAVTPSGRTVAPRGPAEPEPLAPPPGPPPVLPRLTGLDLDNIDRVWSEGREPGSDGHLSRELTARITQSFASQIFTDQADVVTKTIVGPDGADDGRGQSPDIAAQASDTLIDEPDHVAPDHVAPDHVAPDHADAPRQAPARSAVRSNAQAGPPTSRVARLPALAKGPVGQASQATWTSSLLGWLFGVVIVAAISALVYFLL